MGLIAQYMMVNEEILDSLMDSDNEELTARLFEIEESEEFESMNIDKLWDVLHYFLTKKPATDPIEGNKLSEAIVGVHPFSDDEEADFITCTEREELPEIINAIKHIDVEKLYSDFNMDKLKAAGIYPSGIWNDGREQLFAECKEALTGLSEFYKRAFKKGYHIIVSIL